MHHHFFYVGHWQTSCLQATGDRWQATGCLLSLSLFFISERRESWFLRIVRIVFFDLICGVF